MQKIKVTLKRLRREKQLTQQILADKLGISLRAYSKIEAGKTSLNIERLRDLATVFDLTMPELLFYLFDEDMIIPAPNNITIYRHYEETIALLKQQCNTLNKLLAKQAKN
jgi:transcriptional regulator with XRE-family HTH domain